MNAMGLGKQVRLNRLFSHPSGRLFAVAVDHFIGYNLASLPAPLRQMSKTLEQIIAGKPDAVTMHRGVADFAWKPFAGRTAFILQSILCRADDTCFEQIADVEDAVRLGADALACSGFVHARQEAQTLKMLSENVKAAARYDMPIITHIYPLTKSAEVSFACEDIAWAVHCGVEVGCDVIKTPYCNDVKGFAQIVKECPVPVVAAGGPKTPTFEASLAMLADVVKSGAKGATVGRNVWGNPHITEAVVAIAAVIHDGKSPREAMKLAGIKA
jgi:class I fructose-bisphosphate aldolase